MLKHQDIQARVKRRYPVGKYLVTSYLYYHCDISVISDEEYDDICRELHDGFEDIEHPHKHLLDKDSLAAGTAYHLTATDYPFIVRNIAMAERMEPGYVERLFSNPPAALIQVDRSKKTSLLDFT